MSSMREILGTLSIGQSKVVMGHCWKKHELSARTSSTLARNCEVEGFFLSEVILCHLGGFCSFTYFTFAWKGKEDLVCKYVSQ